LSEGKMGSNSSAILVATIALAFVVGTSARADAALLVYFCNDAGCTGGDDILITDQGAGDNFPGSAQVGQINAGAIDFAGFTILTNIGQSKPLIGSASAPQLDLTFNAVTNDNLEHLVFLYAADTDFTGTGPFLLELGGTQGPGCSGNTIQGRAWGGALNSIPADPRGVGPLLANTGATCVSPFALSVGGELDPTVNPYALTIGVQLTRTTAGATTGDLSLVPIPEPASMGLFGLGMMGLAWYRSRKGNQAP
jgi:hypothetical protein